MTRMHIWCETAADLAPQQPADRESRATLHDWPHETLHDPLQPARTERLHQVDDAHPSHRGPRADPVRTG